MKNVLKAALVLGTLGTPMIALAGDPAGSAPAPTEKAPKAGEAPVAKPVEAPAKGAKKAGEKAGEKAGDKLKEGAKEVKAN
jgi:hypothetical protein